MTENEARARIERLTAASWEPLLDAADVTDLLVRAAIADENGRSTDDANWEPTWDINAAAAMGWDVKAARCADHFRFEEDNQAFYREHVFAHCEAMAKRYRTQAVYV